MEICLFDVRCKCLNMNANLRRYYGKPIAPMLGYTQKDYKYLLEHPTPDFFYELYNLHYFAMIGECDELYNKYKKKYAVYKSHHNKKR